MPTDALAPVGPLTLPVGPGPFLWIPKTQNKRGEAAKAGLYRDFYDAIKEAGAEFERTSVLYLKFVPSGLRPVTTGDAA